MRVSAPFLVLALAAACGGKKQPPGGGSAAPGTGTAAGTAGAGSAAGPAAPTPPPPAKPLPPLAEDPGGATGTVEWVTSWGGVKTDVPRALVVTGDATLVLGDFDEEATFGSLGAKQAAGKSDGYLLRLDGKGTPEWVTTFGGKLQERASELAMDAAGNLAVAGLYAGTLTAGELSATSKKDGSDDLFVMGLDGKGTVQWLWTAGGDGSDDVTALAAYPGGGWIAAVSFAREIALGKTTLTARGGEDAALVKLSASGEVEWVTQLGGEYPDFAEHLAVDPNGNIFVLGRFTRSIDLGGGPLEGFGPTQLFLARFDGNGRHVWGKSIGNAFEEIAGGLAIDQAGTLALTGSFDKEVDFLGTKITAASEADVFVARVDADGKPLWVKTFGGSRAEAGQAIAVDAAGNVVAAGWFETPIDLGAGAMTSKGLKDGWVVKLGAADGAHRWSRRFGDWDHDGPTALAIAADGSIRLGGLYRYKLDLRSDGPTAVQADGQKFAKADAFVAKLAR